MELRTSDNVRLEARVWPAARDRRGAVVLVHGFAAGMSEPRVVAVAEALRDTGFDVVGYDARGHGGSDGEATLGDRERFDVEAATDAVDAGPVVLVGASMGAIAALRFAAATPDRVGGVVVVSCPSRWRLPRNARGVLSAALTQTSVGREFARRRIGVRIARPASRPAPPLEVVRTLAVPLAIIHGRCDPFIAPDEADRLYGAASDPRRLELVDGLGHAFEARSIAPIVTAVDWCLRAADGARGAGAR